jgi:predicted 2-oxoglutarate/Fe(II)-dependent dioxygenase YbiX
MINLEDYIKVYPKLDKEFCNQIIFELKKSEWEQHKFYNNKDKLFSPRSGNKELDVTWDNIPSKKELTAKTWETISQYILTDLNKSYFSGWSGFTNIRFNRYEETKFMALHCDHIHSMFDGDIKGIPIISVLGLLNDDFEGGEFLMFDDEKKMDLKAGDIMIFPSLFLYPHRVAPVTKGIRYAFVAWVW